jgi:hypothetical protein
MRASAAAVWLGIGMLLGARASAAEGATEPEPDIELLEYLGGLVQEQGGWVGPDDMKGMVDERNAPIVGDDDAGEGDE